MTLTDALTECLREAGIRIEPGSCLWVMEKDQREVWIYMENMDGEITSYRFDWHALQHKIVMKKED